MCRFSDDEAEHVGGGAGDAAVLAGVAELAAETRRPRLHRARQRGQVSTCEHHSDRGAGMGGIESMKWASVSV